MRKKARKETKKEKHQAEERIIINKILDISVTTKKKKGNKFVAVENGRGRRGTTTVKGK